MRVPVKRMLALLLVVLLSISTSLPVLASQGVEDPLQEEFLPLVPLEDITTLGDSGSNVSKEEASPPPKEPAFYAEDLVLIDEDFEANTLEDLSIEFIKSKPLVELSLEEDPEDSENQVLQMKTPDGGIYVDTEENWSNYIFECRMYVEEFNSGAGWENIAPVWYATPAERGNWNKYAVKYRKLADTHTFYKRFAASDNDLSHKPAASDFMGQWHDYRIVADGDTFTVTLDGQELFQVNDSSLKGGTIGFDSAILNGNCTVLIDDILLTRQETASPSADKESGSYSEDFMLTLTPAYPGDTIYYTLDGRDPVEHGTLYGEPIHITADTTLKMVATADGKAYSEVVVYEYTITSLSPPTLTPRPGVYKDSVTVTLQTDTPDAEIYYTTDLTEPTKETGSLYTEPFVLTENTTVKAVTVKFDFSNSAVITGEYEITDQDINNFYVAVNGDDSGTGQEAAPFATLARARDAVRQVSHNMTGDITVHVAAGEYYLEETLGFSSANSGSNGFKINYVSADGPGKARIIGGKNVGGTGWSLCDDSDVGYDLRPELKNKVYRLDLPSSTQDFNTLYVNGNRARLARVQNYEHDERFPMQMGPYMRTAGGGIWDIVYKQGDLDQHSIAGMVNAQARGDKEIAQVTGWDGSGWNWMTSTIPLQSIDEGSRRLHFFKDPSDPGMYRAKFTMGANARYFLQGNLAFLDTPGEFFYSKDRNTLYYYPLPGEDLTTAEIIAPQMETAIQIKGEDKAHVGDTPNPEEQVHDIVFDGFSIEGTDFPSYYSYGWNSYDAKGAIGYYPPEAHEEGITLPTFCEQTERPQFQVGGIVMRDTNNITIKNSELSNIGMTGIVLWQDNESNTITNCHIKETGYCAILIDGGYPGVGEYNGYHTFDNLVIHNTGELVGHAASVTLLRSGYNDFSHIEIYNSPRRAVFVGEWRPRYNGPGTPNDSGYDPYRDIVTHDNHFEYMYLHDLQHDGGDDGAIFVAGLYDGRSGAELHKKNYFNQIVVDKVGANANMLDIRPNGINLDMGASGTSMTDVMIVNAHQYNFRYDNDYRDVYYFDNINSWYGDGERHDKTFDLSRMEFDQIGVTEDFPFAIPSRQAKHYDDVYFREEFNEGLSDWWELAGKPATSSVYFSQEKELYGHSFMADSYYNKTERCLIGKPFGHELNKIVEIDFFDHTRVRNAVYHLTFQSALDSFARVDDGNYQKAIGVDTTFDSAHYSYKIGTLTRSTDITRTYGWHTFKWDYTSGTEVKMYIDDQLIATVPAKHFSYIEMGDYGAGGYNAYDNVVIYQGDSALPPIALPETPDIEEPETVNYLPGTVQAEDTTVWPGNSKKESIPGGSSVGYIGVGDVFKYDVTLPEAITDATVSVRHATNGNLPGQIKISFDDADNTSLMVELPGTGGWTSFAVSEAPQALDLAAGEYTMSVEVVRANINLDWFSFLLEDTTVVPVESLALGVDTSKPLTLSVGDSLVLPYRVLPQNASNQKVLWSKEDALDILTVEPNGNITAHRPGEAQVIVTSEENPALTDRVSIQVKDTQAGLISTPDKGVTASVSTFWDYRYPAANLIDGDLSTEWVSNQHNPPITDAEPTATLTWDNPKTVSTIYAYDRANSDDFTQVVDITIQYDDGTPDETMELTGLSNDGKTPGILSFDTPKTNVKAIIFAIDRTKNPSLDDKGALGFSELKVYSTPPTDIPVHSILFDKDNLTLFEGMSITLDVPIIVPSTATNLSYQIDILQSDTVVSLEEHRVDGVLKYYTLTSLQPGQAVLRATANNGVYTDLTVTVGVQGDLADTILVAEGLYYNIPGHNSAHEALKEAIDQAIAVYGSSQSPEEHQAAKTMLENAIEAFQQALAGVEKTAQQVAEEIQLSPLSDTQTRLELPWAPFGFMFTMSTTPADIITQTGYIIRPEKDTLVEVQFTVHKLADQTTAQRVIELVVPGSLARHSIQVGSAVQNGTIVANANGKPITHAQKGTTITLEVAPHTDHRLQSGTLKAGEKTIDDTLSFVMPDAPITLHAVFERLYGVQIASLTNGAIAADKTSAAAGETVQLTVTPASGYQLKTGSLQVNGTSVTGLTFSMPAKNAVVTALFTKATSPPDPDPTPDPTPSPTPPSTDQDDSTTPVFPDKSPNPIPKQKEEIETTKEEAKATEKQPASSGGTSVPLKENAPKQSPVLKTEAEDTPSKPDTPQSKEDTPEKKEEEKEEKEEKSPQATQEETAEEVSPEAQDTQENTDTSPKETQENKGNTALIAVLSIAAIAVAAGVVYWIVRVRKP